MDATKIHDNKRYVGYWFRKDPQTMTYHHKSLDIVATFELMDKIVHSYNLDGLISYFGINHAEAVKKLALN